MKYTDAFAELEKRFGRHGIGAPSETDLVKGTIERIIVSSGGTMVDREDKQPVLCLDEAIATRLWYWQMVEVLRDRIDASIGRAGNWRIVDGPHLDKWHTTVEDSMNTQRLAEKRYTIVATVEVIRRT